MLESTAMVVEELDENKTLNIFTQGAVNQTSDLVDLLSCITVR